MEIVNIISQLSTWSKEELLGFSTVMVLWDEMVEQNIIEKDDLYNIKDLSKDKQEKIKEYVMNKLESGD